MDELAIEGGICKELKASPVFDIIGKRGWSHPHPHPVQDMGRNSVWTCYQKSVGAFVVLVRHVYVTFSEIQVHKSEEDSWKVVLV